MSPPPDDVLSLFRRHTRVILGVTVVAGLLGATWQFFQPRRYTASASFIGQSKRGASPLAGFAAQFGLAGIAADGAQSPQFFSDLVTSPGVLRDVVKTSFTFVRDGQRKTGTLIDIYDLDSPGKTSPDERLQHAVEHLSKQIQANVTVKTGLISLQVRAPDPDLAVEIATTIIEKVDGVNLRIRQSQAQADRQFAEMRVGELRAELRAAEDRLQDFMQSNKDYRSSPRQTIEQERLSREVDMRQQVYGSMAASYEQDRIESVRDNPLVTIVDAPVRPAKADSRGIGKGFVIAAVLGGLLSLFGAYLVEARRNRFAGSSEIPAVASARKVFDTASVL
jgi:uncharacterized protein involved in exopolysaccharide biosynthesis